ncbi:olfactory receptor 11A1-like [Betta splendens]|uniref:Olfactory receptor n=1 Tax=Betta splendens TaxID=158456 RepID=A0A8M1H928_BETSP|nr:olfactory receptor 11A1-like [Betta splendens]XP_055361198.1 olfactory receptor 11A1-like [Betta splendens]XP_055361199.1 olfactory receptor 11A1-like [Betta splendens]
MGNKLVNVTYITRDGYVELSKYRCLYFLLLFTAYVLILCSNSTIVCLIVLHRSLHEPMYVFIAALLTNSLLFSSALYPKLLLDVLSETPVVSYPVCLFQWFMYYTLGGSEFLLLAAMAYDRYVSICRPLLYPSIMRKANVCVCLLLAWILPFCYVSVPIARISNEKLCNFTLKGIICNSIILKLVCSSVVQLNTYGLLVLVNILLLPLLFILFTYIRILIISYRSGRDVRRKAANTCLPHLLVLISFSCLGIYDVLLAQIKTDFSNTMLLIMSLQVILYHPLFNPIIYGVKMKEIYKHVIKLFCSKVYH